jgi:hypothetical protein
MTAQLHILAWLIVSGSVPPSPSCPHSSILTELPLFYPSFECVVLNRKIPNVGVVERVAAAVAAMWHSVSVCEYEGHQHLELCD